MKGRLAELERIFNAVEAERLLVTEGTPYRYFLEGFGQGLHCALEENAGVSSSKEVAESREKEKKRIEAEERHKKQAEAKEDLLVKETLRLGKLYACKRDREEKRGMSG